MATGTLDLGAFSIRPMASVSGDLDDYKSMGIYLIPSNTTIANKPNSDCYMLIVLQTSQGTSSRWQFAFGFNHMFVRYLTDGSNPHWTSWSSVYLTTMT